MSVEHPCREIEKESRNMSLEFMGKAQAETLNLGVVCV